MLVLDHGLDATEHARARPDGVSVDPPPTSGAQMGINLGEDVGASIARVGKGGSEGCARGGMGRSMRGRGPRVGRRGGARTGGGCCCVVGREWETEKGESGGAEGADEGGGGMTGLDSFFASGRA